MKTGVFNAPVKDRDYERRTHGPEAEGVSAAPLAASTTQAG
jgi:hypothetical protein